MFSRVENNWVDRYRMSHEDCTDWFILSMGICYLWYILGFRYFIISVDISSRIKIYKSLTYLWSNEDLTLLLVGGNEIH